MYEKECLERVMDGNEDGNSIQEINIICILQSVSYFKNALFLILETPVEEKINSYIEN